MVAELLSRFKTFSVPVLRSYSAVLFNSNLWGGALLLFLTFLNPNLGIGGLVSLLSSYIFARLIGFKEGFLRLDYYIYNPLLVGLSLGYLFKLNLLSLLFFSVAGIFTFLLTYTLSSVFYTYLKLPVLSLPFVVVSSVLYLASSKFSQLFVSDLYPHSPLLLSFHLPLPVKGFLSSLGAIFFLPYPLSGFLIALVLFFVSRILFFLSLLGYFSGTFTAYLFTGSWYKVFSDTSAFNYILTSMAVGGVFLIPSIRSYKFALTASVISVPIVEGAKVFWESYGLPVFALPFNAVSLLFLYVLFSVGWVYVTRVYKGTPERTLDHYLTYSRRFPFTGREIGLPFSGEWTVWQSFNGEWTHKGPWRYAVDFVITDEKGKTFSGSGSQLTDYYAFGKPVLSPVDGQVISVVSDLPDNSPGTVDRENNWGNYVLLYDNRGFYVLICHFKQNSIKVKPGDTVTRGTLLGLCGNSGYSPQPHIHVHVQLYSYVGAPTVPFSFTSYVSGDRFYDAGVPEKGEVVYPVYPDKSLYHRFNFLIDQTFRYILSDGDRTSEFTVTVRMAPDGTFYLTDGEAKLYFGIKNSTFYFYHFEGNTGSPLKYFFFAASKIPLSFSQNLRWFDYLPFISLFSRFRRELYLFLSSFNHNLFVVRSESSWLSPSRFETVIIQPGRKLKASVGLSDDVGFEEITFGDKITVRRVGDEETNFTP